MNTGFLGPAVATVLTACGIETILISLTYTCKIKMKLQQYLPLAVLKRSIVHLSQKLFQLQQYLPLAVLKHKLFTKTSNNLALQQYLPLAVLKLSQHLVIVLQLDPLVATVLTACGIETLLQPSFLQNRIHLLQQYLPLAVLKPNRTFKSAGIVGELQQYLPLAVLKLF